MAEFFGLDTSNYTTSAAVYDNESDELRHKRKLLPVKDGQAGLRQSDALFHHTIQLTEVSGGLLSKLHNLKAIGVSAFPRMVEGSYMPCFLAGKTAAEMLAAVTGAKLYYTSHQIGHIMAALYSCGRKELIHEKFLAFHISGGTTECLLCTPHKLEVVNCELFSGSLDLKAGQAVDRVGLMLGLKFPCGSELEKLAQKSTAKFMIKPSMKGKDCSLSGVENKCRKMLDEGVPHEDIALYCLTFIGQTLISMTDAALAELGKIPVLYAGGVMSNLYIREMIEKKYKAYFAKPEFSSDNAAGAAIIAAEKYKRQI